MSTDEGVRLPLSHRDMPSHKKFAPDPPQRLFHYTDVRGAHGIITSKSLWLTKIQYLNDTRELIHAIERFQTLVDSPSTRSKYASSHLKLVRRAAAQLESFTQTNIFVASFCENPDLLSQWRGYAQRGGGLSLGFNVTVLCQLAQQKALVLFKCVYRETEQLAILSDLADILVRASKASEHAMGRPPDEKLENELIGYFNTTFLRVASVLKDEAFAEEREWRLVTASTRFTDPECDVRLSGDILVPYYDLKFEKPKGNGWDFLPDVWFGPTSDRALRDVAIRYLFLKNGFGELREHISKIPFSGT